MDDAYGGMGYEDDGDQQQQVESQGGTLPNPFDAPHSHSVESDYDDDEEEEEGRRRVLKVANE